MTDESLYKRKEKGREAFVPATVSEGGQAEENLESFVLKPLYTRKELQEFKERNSVGNVFRTTRQTVRSAEDLEKLFFYMAGSDGKCVWQWGDHRRRGRRNRTGNAFFNAGNKRGLSHV